MFNLHVAILMKLSQVDSVVFDEFYDDVLLTVFVSVSLSANFVFKILSVECIPNMKDNHAPVPIPPVSLLIILDQR